MDIEVATERVRPSAGQPDCEFELLLIQWRAGKPGSGIHSRANHPPRKVRTQRYWPATTVTRSW